MSSTRAALLLLLLSLPLTACQGLDNFGFSDFEPVDSDFSRPSPLTTVESALQQSCEGTHDATLQQDEEVFGYALCLCESLSEVGEGLVTRSSSHLLGDNPGMGHVAINGPMEVVGDLNVDGTLNVSGGLSGVGNLNVGQDLLSGANVDITGTWEVGRDAWIDGDLSGVGTINIGNDLYLTGDLDTVGSVNYNLGREGFSYRGDPCPCGPSQVLDVEGVIAAHATDNDNALLPETIGDQTLTLQSGRYYFSSPTEVVGSTSIVAQGHVELYLDGDLDSVGDLNIVVEPQAELELWISGTISSVGNLSFVDGNLRPRAFKLFMGGKGNALVSVGNAILVGAIYAPEVDFEYVGNLEVHGSLFANSIDGTGNLNIIYDTDLPVPQDCAEDKYAL